MNQIKKRNKIDESQLDQKFYFQSIFQVACQQELLTEDRIQKIQLELVELMGKEVERYTNDESSSIRIEKAQELLQSITFSIGYFLKNTTDMTQKLDILKNNKIADLYYAGMKAISECYMRAKHLLQDMQNRCPKLNNYAYQDTIYKALPAFFHDYNIEFGAQEIPTTIDYPLFDWGPDYLGVEYIYEYLRRLTLEDHFLRHYPVENINLLLKAFDLESEHNLINIFELVLYNALGCILLGKNSRELHISQKESRWLQQKLALLPKVELLNHLVTGCEGLIDELDCEAELAAYMMHTIPNLAERLKYNLQTNTINKLFVSLEYKYPEENFEDGLSMDDEKLRRLVDHLRNIDTTEDKIALMREYVQSTADLMELLEESFYEEEYEKVIASFSETEKEILRKSILLDFGPGHAEDYEPQKSWQKLLFG